MTTPHREAPEDNSWQQHRSIMESLGYLFKHKVAADVTFIIDYQDGETKSEAVHIKAHKMLLLARSSVFYAMFCGELKETTDTITITEIEPEAFQEFLWFIYTDQTNFTHENVSHIMYAAQKYMIQRLVDACNKFLRDNLNPSNVTAVIQHSILFDQEALMTKSVDYFTRNIKASLKGESFRNLSASTIKTILEMDALNTPEINIFNACLVWAEAECERRGIEKLSKNLRSVLEMHLPLIRFPTMSVEEFGNGVASHDILTDAEGYAVYKYITCDKKQASLPYKNVNRNLPCTTTQALNNPGPFKTESLTSSTKEYKLSTKLTCNTSRLFKLEKIVVHAFEGATNKYEQVKLTYKISQEGKIITSKAQEAPASSSYQSNAAYTISLSDTLLQKGTFELEFVQSITVHQVQECPKHTMFACSCSYKPLTGQGRNHTLNYYGREDCTLADKYLTLKIEKADWMPIVSMQYRLP